MKGFLHLLLYSAKRVRTLVLGTGVLLACFQLILIVVARSLQKSNAFGELNALIPPFVRELLGPSLIGMMSFQGIVGVGYIDVPVMGALVALAVAIGTMPASEMETGFADLILARPLARHWMITRSIVVLTLSTLLLIAMMMAGTFVGLETLAPKDAAWPSPRLILSLATNLGMLTLAWGGVALAIASASQRRGAAGTFAGLLALATFLLDYIARAWQPAEAVAWLSPFRYYNPFDLLNGSSLSPKNLFVLAGIAIAGFVTAYVTFSRRDITH